MRVAVQPKYFGDDPKKGIQSITICVMPDLDLGDEKKEESGVRDFLDHLRKSEALEITALGQDSFTKPVSLRAFGRALAVDW